MQVLPAHLLDEGTLRAIRRRLTAHTRPSSIGEQLPGAEAEKRSLTYLKKCTL